MKLLAESKKKKVTDFGMQTVKQIEKSEIKNGVIHFRLNTFKQMKKPHQIETNVCQFEEIPVSRNETSN